MSANYYQTIYKLISQRSIDATVGMLGITDQELREHLIQEFMRHNKKFLASPVFESTFPWEHGEKRMAELSGNLFCPSLIKAMNNAKENRFDRAWFPFKHQLKAWDAAIKQKKSIIVTSGTGSGKTECFMLPILNDLVTEYEQNNDPLIGVRALFIYPLNALINSQRERLRAWTRSYDDGIRFCLYNGNTEENKHLDQGKFPNEILTRKIMRKTPAPMLVTNSTMLEYMLIRQIDAPIIQQSKGLLRWIVLDEAHTYVGSQAAELSLLLRRVMHTFKVDVKNIRFVATSATIGSSDNKLKTEEQLQRYLASLAGVDTEQVIVVGGQREVPQLPSLPIQQCNLKEILKIDPDTAFSEKRFQVLASHPVALKIRKILATKNIPSTLSELSKELFKQSSPEIEQEVLAWIDICSHTSKPSKNKENTEPFLPLRGHLFHQVISGLWCCVDKHCPSKKKTPLTQKWPFGRVFTQHRHNCDCGAPIYELVFCNDCNTPHLVGTESKGVLLQTKQQQAIDEFSLDYEYEETTEVKDSSSSDVTIIAPQSHSELTYLVSIDKERSVTSPSMETIDLTPIHSSDLKCVQCEFDRTPFYRHSFLGAPFYISNTMPSLLESCKEGIPANDLPSRGKRLITFTDSRQGTARISIKVQQDSERDSIRSSIYNEIIKNIFLLDDLDEKKEKLTAYKEKIKKFQQMGEKELAKDLEKMADELSAEIKQNGTIQPVLWSDMVNELCKKPDIKKWMFRYYKDFVNSDLFGDTGGNRILTEILLLREFARRPKRKNSMETLGLVSIQYPTLKQITKTPNTWQKLKADLNDWHCFLKLILDFYIRENSMIDINRDWIKCIGIKIYPKTVTRYNSQEAISSGIKRWPQVVYPKQNNRLIRILEIAFKLNVEKPKDKDLINGLLQSAWTDLTKKYPYTNKETKELETHQILKENEPGQFYLSCNEIAFQFYSEAWVCPQTHRLIDSTFRGITPYLPRKIKETTLIICKKIKLPPPCNLDNAEFSSNKERKEAIRDWLKQQAEITELRRQNLWTDITDKVIEGSQFIRVAEHSAQQPSKTLDKYETSFKKGQINILSCSTTMEMGVDIGGISIVAMNNVPPHPANYLQRAGRAGRRGETQALAFTICKDNPHERSVFANPKWPFETTIKAPHITLNSQQIVQRHINSLLLAVFLNEIISESNQERIKLKTEWFFIDKNEENISTLQAPADKMLRWLKEFTTNKTTPDYIQKGINMITNKSILASKPIKSLFDESIKVLKEIKEKWLPQYQKLQQELETIPKNTTKDPYLSKIKHDLKAIGNQYLLSELASYGFLPAYGFPTGIATFDHYSISDYKKGKYTEKGRIDNMARLRDRPGRDLPTAIREYAPGADVILNGLVYRSAGILINNFSPNEDYSEPQKMQVEWRCHHCGWIDNELGTTFDKHCSQCGEKIKLENTKEYIQPIGFAVDFYSEPSTDISTQSYIPVQEPWVTAHTELNQLFEPRLGSYRASTQGHIFYHSSGQESDGYVLCLRCGRSESTFSNEIPASFKNHNKLQGKMGGETTAKCEGSHEPYAIKNKIHFGTTDQTNVFELYLKNPSENIYIKHHSQDKLGWTLAVALRQSLADIHGINGEEIGYTIKPTTLPHCEYPVLTIVLFDKAAGGAGFSYLAPRYIKKMFQKSLNYLDCDDNCNSACQSCLLGYDTRFHAELLNRHVALEYIEKIMPYLTIPQEAKFFNENTSACYESLYAEILRHADNNKGVLKIFVQGNYHLWDISNSHLKEDCLHLKQLFSTIELVLPNDKLTTLEEVHKEDLKALLNMGISLCILEQPLIKLSQLGILIAQIINEKNIISFASNAPEVNQPNHQWWQTEGFFLTHSSKFKEIKTQPLDKSLLMTEKVQGDIEVEISKECDGPLFLFGNKFWQVLIKQSDALQRIFKQSVPLLEIKYSDCYIHNPWSLMLFTEVIIALKFNIKDQFDNTKITLITSEKRGVSSGYGIYHEWSREENKAEIINQYFALHQKQIDTKIKPIKKMPHGRLMTLCWGDKTITTIRLDHGFGCWKPVKNIRFDSNDSVNEMYKIRKELSVIFNKEFPTQIFIKHR